MNFSDFARDFHRLSFPSKSAFFAAVLALGAAFLPWFAHMELSRDEGGRVSSVIKTGSGFSAFPDAFPVFGFLSFFAAVLAFVVFVRFFLGNEKTFGFSAARIWIFLGGEVAFGLLLAFFVFSSLSTRDTTATIRFGLPLSLFAHLLLCGSGYLMQREEIDREHRSVLFPSTSPGHLGVRPEAPHISEDQLSLADTPYERR